MCSVLRGSIGGLQHFRSDAMVLFDENLIRVRVLIVQLNERDFHVAEPWLVVLYFEQGLLDIRTEVFGIQPLGLTSEILNASVVEDIDEGAEPIDGVEASHYVSGVASYC